MAGRRSDGGQASSGGGGRSVYGVGPVRELLRARASTVHVIFVSDSAVGKRNRGGPVPELAAEAARIGIIVETKPRAELDALVEPGARHQGVVAVAGELEYADADDIVEAAEARGEAPLLVALDGVQDPHNLGAIVRTAYLLGAHGVLVPRDRAARVTPVVTKASAGATEHLPIAQVGNLVRALEDLKQRGLWIAGLAAGEGATPLWQFDGTGPLCLVLGAEGAGMRRLVTRTCDYCLEIPMARPGVGSFNVSVAGALVLGELARQRAAQTRGA